MVMNIDEDLYIEPEPEQDDDGSWYWVPVIKGGSHEDQDDSE